MRSCPQCSAECASDHRFCPACGFPIGALRTAAGDPLIGRTLGGAYVILENVGSGGMGRVYRAEQISLGKTLAVKVIHPHLISDESATARFYTEARASSRLNHPNSVSVLDFGRTDDGLLYLVMEFLRGKDLAHILWEQGPLSGARAVGIMRQMLAALSEAHDLGIIHRDIKPENILIEPLRTGGDFVKVVDFGLAKVRADVAPSVTMPGIVCGTPDYMAPEQGRGDPLDPRSDLYACGVLLFQVLTARLPFEAESPTQIVLMHMTDMPPDPRSFVPGIPDRLAEQVLKALSKEAKDRHQSAVEMAEALADSIREPERSKQSSLTVPTIPITVPCPNCGEPVGVGVKFCGECGARMPLQSPRPASLVPPRTQSDVPGGLVAIEQKPLPFVGRDLELAQLEAARVRATRGRMAAARVVGDLGFGKHRLFEVFAERMRAKGDAVVLVGPDAAWANVPYAPIAACVRACVGLSAHDSPIDWLDARRGATQTSDDRAVRAGFQELFSESGPPHLEGRARREAVVRALLFAAGDASKRAASGVAVLVFEQLHRVDTASMAALTSLTSRTVAQPVLLLGSHTSRTDPRWLNSEAITLRGFELADALTALAGSLPPSSVDVASALEAAGDDIPPLYVDQLARWTMEGGGVAPPRLVDLVSARFERLAPIARRAVQALAILGEASGATLSQVLGEEVGEASRAALLSRGWLVADETSGVLSIGHALLREVAEASIPAAARTPLHQKCSEVLADTDAPLEARALHAADAEDPFQALVMLERVGDRAVVRGDDLGAAHALRRGLERARRELVRGEIDEPEQPLAIFARKLADALMRAGEAAEAEGVLREGLELLPRSNVEWARLEGTLAKALFARGRTPDSVRAIDEAVKTARRMTARAAAAELSVVRAEIEEALGNSDEAIAQLRIAESLSDEAVRALSTAGMRRATGEEWSLQKLRVEILLRLARVTRLSGDDAGARAPLDLAATLAERFELLSERMRCEAERAECGEALGDRREAAAAWARAATRASDLGDPLEENLYRERERRLGV